MDDWGATLFLTTRKMLKEHLLSICHQRNDGRAMEVRVRLNDDLHAADGRFRKSANAGNDLLYW